MGFHPACTRRRRTALTPIGVPDSPAAKLARRSLFGHGASATRAENTRTYTITATPVRRSLFVSRVSASAGDGSCRQTLSHSDSEHHGSAPIVKLRYTAMIYTFLSVYRRQSYPSHCHLHCSKLARRKVFAAVLSSALVMPSAWLDWPHMHTCSDRPPYGRTALARPEPVLLFLLHPRTFPRRLHNNKRKGLVRG